VFDDSKASEKWVRVCTEIAVEGCQASGVVGSPNAGASSAAAISYTSVDAWHSLLMFLAKNIPEDAARSSMLNRALAVVFTALSTDADACRLEPDAGRAFDQRPYLRLLTGILADCLGPGAEAPLQALDVQVLTSYASLLHSVQPERVPGFSFAWVELFSHRLFLPRLLQLPEQRGWPIVHTLLADLLRFQYPYLQNAELTEGLRLLYRTTLRVLLVLLHDFPDFLAEHHFALCNAIPPSCVQMRNLILSAFPRDIQLPDPFAPDLKIDLLPQITVHPRVRSAVASALPVDESEVAAYLRKRSPSHFPASLITTLGVTDDAREAPGTRFSAAAIHALVLTVGTLDLRLAEEAAGGKLAASAITAQVQRSAAMDIFRRLITSLPPDGRAMLISSIANQLRYPNAHTHYFSCVLLVLFVEASSDDIREQITRLLLERLIVHRPHPWGLLITVIELMKNPRYKLWSYDFTRCAPEIERLLDSVARSCNAKTEASEA
jgi:CCR4-NOT transcription complex subunit 1